MAVCDEDLLGKTLKEGKLEFKITKHFYGGEKKTDKETLAILNDAHSVNLVGKNAVALGIKAGIIEKSNIKIIQGVPHAQSFTL